MRFFWLGGGGRGSSAPVNNNSVKKKKITNFQSWILRWSKQKKQTKQKNTNGLQWTFLSYWELRPCGCKGIFNSKSTHKSKTNLLSTWHGNKLVLAPQHKALWRSTLFKNKDTFNCCSGLCIIWNVWWGKKITKLFVCQYSLLWE